MVLIGYARVSTADQELEPQRRALDAAGCLEIVAETASGADRTRPELARLLARIGRGDTLVVLRIDRLARSLAHLLEIIGRLQAKGAAFRSLSDPIDTSGPSGTLILQILGAVAEFERALIRERTLAGLAAARAAGRVGGNPKLRQRDQDTITGLAAARRASRLATLLPGAEPLLAELGRLRPQLSWSAVAAELSRSRPPGLPPFTPSGLARLARLFVAEGWLDPGVLRPAPRRRPHQGAAQPGRAADMAAAYLRARPDATLAELGTQLLRLGVYPARGGSRWASSTLQRLREYSRRL